MGAETKITFGYLSRITMVIRPDLRRISRGNSAEIPPLEESFTKSGIAFYFEFSAKVLSVFLRKNFR